MRILMVGLDAAGKTTILYKLKLGEGTSVGHSRMFGALFADGTVARRRPQFLVGTRSFVYWCALKNSCD
jgi:hypothetical protein